MVEQQLADQPAQQTTKVIPNILALPRQTTILVVMLVSVIYITLVGIILATEAPMFSAMAPGLLLLSIRLWMAWPERRQRMFRPKSGYSECPRLQVRIAELACCLHIKRVPQLMLTDKPGALEIYGGWLRWFIVINRGRARAMEAALEHQRNVPFVDAFLIHELHHFRFHDHRIIEYTRALLRTSITFIGWLALLNTGVLVMVWLSAQQLAGLPIERLVAGMEAVLPGVGVGEILRQLLPSEAEWSDARAQAMQMNLPVLGFGVILNMLPVILFGGLLSRFLWRKLSRLRELYADAGVAHTQGRIEYLLYASQMVGSTTEIDPTSASPDAAAMRSRWVGGRLTLPAWLRRAGVLGRGPLALIDSIRRWSDPTPPPRQRQMSLQNPRYVFDSRWGTIKLIALFVLILEILLTNSSSLFYVGAWPMHFPTLALFILVSLSLVVGMVLGRDVWRERYVMVLSLLALRSLLIVGLIALLGLALVVDPDGLSVMLNIQVRIISGFFQKGLDDVIGDLGAVLIQLAIVNLSQLPVVGLLVWFGVGLVVRIAQRVLTWYSFPAQGWLWHDDSKPDRRWYHLDPDRRLLYVIYAVIALLALTIALAVLPLLTDLVVWRWEGLVAPSRWLAVLLVLPLLAGGALWWRRLDQLYGRRCPKCGSDVPGPYELGRTCGKCHELLNPWLVARYSAEVSE